MDILVQSRRDKKAAKQFFRKLLKGLRYVPCVLITDKLRSYSAAKAEVLGRTRDRTIGSRIRTANEVVRKGDETVQVSRSGAAFSLGLRNHNLTLPSGQISVQNWRLPSSEEIKIRRMGRSDLRRGDR